MGGKALLRLGSRITHTHSTRREKYQMPVKIKSDPDVHVKPQHPTSNVPVSSGYDNCDDEIVREIDVYLSPALAKQVYLMQYPLQHQTYSQVEAARLKQRHCIIELDQTTPDEISQSGQYFMPKRTYSSHTVPVSTHMALGKLVPRVSGNVNNKDTAAHTHRQQHDLHLIPLSRIAQMRPSFDHVDEADKTVEEESESTLIERPEEAVKLERKPLSFQKKESERNRLARKSSYAYKKASEEGEPWQSLAVHKMDSMESSKYVKHALCKSRPNNLVVYPEHGEVTMAAANNEMGTTLNSTYVHSLNYLPNSDKRKDAKSNFNNQAVCSRIVGLLRKGMPVPYSLLRSHFPHSVTDETILKALGICALLIRGNFILQSRLLPLSPALAQVRTFVLFLLHTVGFVSRGRLDHAFKNGQGDERNSDAVHVILEQVAQKTPDGWKLKVEDDTNFVDRHPDSLRPFLQFWGDQAHRFGPLLERYRSNDWVPSAGL